MALLDRFRRRNRPAEVRDPRVATRTQHATGPGLAPLDGLSEEQITRRIWLSNVYVDAAIRAIANDLARLTFRAGDNPDRPEQHNPRSPLALLLGPPPGRPNPYTTPRRLWQWTVAQRVALGRWAWEVEVNRHGGVEGLWPLVVRHLDPIAPRPDSRKRAQWFVAFDYTPGGSGTPVRLSPDQVVYDWLPHPDNFRQPLSPLQSARLDAEVLVSQDRYDAAFIRNNNKPATIVVHQEFADPEERDSWRAEFNSAYSGPDNAGRTHFVEQEWGAEGSVKDALDIITVGVSQREAQALERYAAKLRSICVALGVPLGRLGDVSGRTYSNAEREIRTYWENTILPLAVELMDAVNTQLAPRVGGGTEVGWWDFSQVEELRPAPVLALPTLAEAVKLDIISRGEGRTMMGLAGDSIDDDDLEPDDQEDPPTPTEVVGLAEDDRALLRDTLAALRASHSPREEATPAGGPSPAPGPGHRLQQRRSRWAATVESHLPALEATWQRRMQAHFTAQRDAVLARLEGNRGVRAHRRGELRAGAVFDRDYWQARLTAEAEDLYRQAAAMSGGAQAADLGVSFDVSAPHVESFIRTRANQLAGQVTDTTYQAIQQALIEGVQAGEGIPQLADRIRHLFDQTWRSRAETVARTEVISAYNGAAVAAALGYGPEVVAGFEWLATNDHRTRDAHREAHGQQIPLGGAFLVGGERLAYPGDPNGSPENVVNCRCTPLVLTPDEFEPAGAPVVDLRTVEHLAVRAALGDVSWDEALAELTGTVAS